MRKYGITLAALVAALVAGCTEHGPSRPVAAGPASPTASAAAPPSSAAPRPADVAAFLPAGTQVLLPVRSGSGNAELPTFYAKTGSFTFYFQCHGDGDARLAEPGVKADQKLPCDGVLTKFVVFDKPRRHRLTLHAGAGLSWRLGVTGDAR